MRTRFRTADGRARALATGRLIEPAVDPWPERFAAAERLASQVAIERWLTDVNDVGDVEYFVVRLMAVDRLIARASRRRADDQIRVLRAWKDLFVELHRVRCNADRLAEQRTKPLVDGRRAHVESAAVELQTIRREVEAIRRREGCKTMPAIRLYLQRQNPSGRQPKEKAVETLARRLRTRTKKSETTT
jgi:hypothetical protein